MSPIMDIISRGKIEKNLCSRSKR